MITTLIINLAYSLLSGIIALFPIGEGFPSDAMSAMTTLGGYLRTFDPIFPTQTLITTLTILFLVELAIFAFKTIKWIISHIPWIGGRG